jgi:hypothetical protein
MRTLARAAALAATIFGVVCTLSCDSRHITLALPDGGHPMRYSCRDFVSQARTAEDVAMLAENLAALAVELSAEKDIVGLSALAGVHGDLSRMERVVVEKRCARVAK